MDYPEKDIVSPVDARCAMGIPASASLRSSLRSRIQAYVRDHDLKPPLPLDQLHTHAQAALSEDQVEFIQYALVLLSNALWAETFAEIPYEKRLLLLPQCLRDRATCPAETDEYGLQCLQCGRCTIGDFLSEAKALGYVTLVAEGTTLVKLLIETGQVQAVIGAGCLSTLEQVFPYMHVGAIPGLAFPLLHDGCDRTDMDEAWVWDAIYSSTEGAGARLDFQQLRESVRDWFTRNVLDELLGPATGQADVLARDYLCASGKRWRPFLAACCYQAISGQSDTPTALRKLAVAVECFHKASLVHDDIEDNDAMRDGEPTLHEQTSLPVALNVGDYLLGLGYRLIGEIGAENTQAMLAIAAEGHLRLCGGQGEELAWRDGESESLTIEQVLTIHEQKTAPAFEVALVLGALAARSKTSTLTPLRAFSESMGVAYQVLDDLRDAEGEGSDLATGRLSLSVAMREKTPEDRRREMVNLLDIYRRSAMASLEAVAPLSLKILLWRVMGRMFADASMECGCGRHA